MNENLNAQAVKHTIAQLSTLEGFSATELLGQNADVLLSEQFTVQFLTWLL